MAATTIAADRRAGALRWDNVWTVARTDLKQLAQARDYWIPMLILGSIFFAAGLLGEQVAVLRAEQRELRRRLDERSDRHGAA